MGTHSKACKILMEALKIFDKLMTEKRRLGICKHAFKSLLLDFASTKKYIGYCLMKRGMFSAAEHFLKEFYTNSNGKKINLRLETKNVACFCVICQSQNGTKLCDAQF